MSEETILKNKIQKYIDFYDNSDLVFDYETDSVMNMRVPFIETDQFVQLDDDGRLQVLKDVLSRLEEVMGPVEELGKE